MNWADIFVGSWLVEFESERVTLVGCGVVENPPGYDRAGIIDFSVCHMSLSSTFEW